MKIRGEENPADLMTKILGLSDIVERLERMNIRWEKPIVYAAVE